MVKKIALISLLLIGVMAYLNRSKLKAMFFGTPFTINTVEVKLLFKSDPTIDELVASLVENKIVKNEKKVRKEIEEQGLTDSSFDAGKYIVLTKTKLSDLVDGFTIGENGQGKMEVKVNVLFNRCETIEDIGANISKCIIADSASIVDYIYAPTTLSKYGFSREEVPALFLPDNYEMYFDTDAEAFVANMALKFKEFWNEDRKAKMHQLGLNSQSSVTTLASIVYAEQSKVEEEWPIISKLYLNRLHQGILLQSDPTFKFCWGDKLNGVQRLLIKHREIDCPYNTYKYKGLPPGPIRIVPAGVIDAVLNPANVNYIFMCAKPDYSGKHNFAVTNAEHARNARIYQSWLSNELKK